jgi:hypothetical protein
MFENFSLSDYILKSTCPPCMRASTQSQHAGVREPVGGGGVDDVM